MSSLADLINKHVNSRSFENNFISKYNETLLSVKERQPYPSEYTRPSSLGKCARNIFFERTHAPKDEVNLKDVWTYNQVGILESGTDRHERIQNVLFEMEKQGHLKNIDIPTAVEEAKAKGLQTEFVSWNEDKTEARCVNKDYNLYFQADGLIEMNGVKAIFEIKTTSCKKIATIRKSQAPLRPHILQATAYAMCLGVDYILFFYEDRDFTSHYPILYEVPQSIKNEVQAKLAEVDRCVADGDIPAPNKSECTFCEFRQICKEVDEVHET